jgi:hypothetical protein
MLSKEFLFILSRLLLSAMLALGYSTAWAQPWSSVGSAGTVDDEDTGIVWLGNLNNGNPGAVTMPFTATGVLNIRYNVVAVSGLFGGEGHVLSARFRDNGAGGRVVVRLKQFGLYTGVTTTLLTLDSNAFAPSPDFQVQSVGSCATTLNFFENSYFMDVEIIKNAANFAPSLAMLNLGITIC